MELDVLKMMIQAACADGTITEEQRSLLQSRAKELDLSNEDVDFLINAEIDKVKSQINWVQSNNSSQINQSSGFTTNNQSDEGLSSGFVTSNNSGGTSFEPPSKFTELSSKFTDVTTLDKQGAMSFIQRAKFYGKWLIIKRIKEEFKDDQKYRELFYREFENAYHLDHPNIVRLLDKGEDVNGLYYTMEYVDARPLTNLISKGNLNQEQAKEISLQILDALSYVHKKQVYHRDLKPDNILITYKGDNVKILDFGLAASDSFDDNLEKVGTPRYAAPEQQIQGGIVDQRADIYAFGLIFLEMLTGQIENTDVSKFENNGFARVINKCLCKSSADRYLDCEKIIVELNKTTTPTITIPASLQEKIKDFASDGIITQNEKKVLNLEAKALNISHTVINAYVNLELEKVKEKEAKKRKKTNELKRQQQLKDAETRTREKERKLQEREAHLKPSERTIYRGETKKKSGIKFKTIFFIIIAIVAIVLIAKNYKKLKDIYKEKISQHVGGKKLQPKYVMAKKLNLREDKSTTCEIINSYTFGTKVIVLEDEEDGWTRVKINGDTGYMSTKFLGTEDVYINEIMKIEGL